MVATGRSGGCGESAELQAEPWAATRSADLAPESGAPLTGAPVGEEQIPPRVGRDAAVDAAVALCGHAQRTVVEGEVRRGTTPDPQLVACVEPPSGVAVDVVGRHREEGLDDERGGGPVHRPRSPGGAGDVEAVYEELVDRHRQVEVHRDVHPAEPLLPRFAPEAGGRLDQTLSAGAHLRREGGEL